MPINAASFQAIPGLAGKAPDLPTGMETAFMTLASGLQGYQMREEERKKKEAYAFSVLAQLGMTEPPEGATITGPGGKKWGTKAKQGLTQAQKGEMTEKDWMDQQATYDQMILDYQTMVGDPDAEIPPNLLAGRQQAILKGEKPSPTDSEGDMAEAMAGAKAKGEQLWKTTDGRYVSKKTLKEAKVEAESQGTKILDPKPIADFRSPAIKAADLKKAQAKIGVSGEKASMAERLGMLLTEPLPLWLAGPTGPGRPSGGAEGISAGLNVIPDFITGLTGTQMPTATPESIQDMAAAIPSFLNQRLPTPQEIQQRQQTQPHPWAQFFNRR